MPKQVTSRELSHLYGRAHDLMWSTDGLQPQEAFDEFLKYVFFKELFEESGASLPSEFRTLDNGTFSQYHGALAAAIRDLFSDYLAQANTWTSTLWRDAEFHLSDAALLGVHGLFSETSLSEIPFDIRSAALRSFIAPEVRRGLGIYLTPDNVVQMAVAILAPKPSNTVYDPACGSGTFLIEVLKRWRSDHPRRRKPYDIYGTDRNPRMLLLSELNLGHVPGVAFHRRLADFLTPLGSAPWPKPNSFDCILTNPPFGVSVDGSSLDLARFRTCLAPSGEPLRRQNSEVVFIEQCLKCLRPGGTLAIVLPRSVVTNRPLAGARHEIGKLGYVFGVVTLPPETFATTGTQTVTHVVFFRKYEEKEDPESSVRIVAAAIRNVGYDSTGRERSGDELPAVAREFPIARTSRKDGKICRLLPAVRRNESLSLLRDLLTERHSRRTSTDSFRLGDVLDLACTGRTPARSSYSDAGLFLVKVGNLSGRGIDWTPRDRNFIPPNAAADRMTRLQEGDILLTSSAHSPKYIAQKIDIVHDIPNAYGGQASFVAETTLLRLREDTVDPYILLAYLRLPSTRERIRQMIRGQTAHLYPKDVAELMVPRQLTSPSLEMGALAELLREEAQLARAQFDVWERQQNLMAKEL